MREECPCQEPVGWSCSVCSAQGVDAAMQCLGWHLPGQVVPSCRAPQGSSSDSPTRSITSPALSPLPTFLSTRLSGLLSMPRTRPCRGSHSCLYSPGIATSASKTLPWLLPLTFSLWKTHGCCAYFSSQACDFSDCRSCVLPGSSLTEMTRSSP